ncbi:MAG: hypothetical protein ILA13_07435 [Eubacterium sp.]|nr:hypothetical protein [Eubacterium sp.]
MTFRETEEVVIVKPFRETGVVVIVKPFRETGVVVITEALRVSWGKQRMRWISFMRKNLIST